MAKSRRIAGDSRPRTGSFLPEAARLRGRYRVADGKEVGVAVEGRVVQLLVGHGQDRLAAFAPPDEAQVVVRAALGGPAEALHDLGDAVGGNKALAAFEDESGDD